MKIDREDTSFLVSCNVTLDVKTFEDIVDWCNTTLGGCYYRGRGCWQFISMEDAMLFVLTWG